MYSVTIDEFQQQIERLYEGTPGEYPDPPVRARDGSFVNCPACLRPGNSSELRH
jgi:hypothetical protein